MATMISTTGGYMVELLLFAILVMLVLIYLQQKKSVKEVDSYFAAIDLSLRQYFANSATHSFRRDNEHHEQVMQELYKISSHSDRAANILDKAHNPRKSADEDFADWLSTRT